MHETEERVAKELASDGSLYDGYHPQMEMVHRKNAARLAEIMDEHGWPGRSLAGEAGMRAAWRIAQHAIGEPEFQRRALNALVEAISRGDAPAWQAAFLTDRIRVLEGKEQAYGTQFDWDENGEMSPCPIEDAANVNARRQSVGMRPLAEELAAHRKNLANSNEKPPPDYHARRKRMEEWARSVGWRD